MSASLRGKGERWAERVLPPSGKGKVEFVSIRETAKILNATERYVRWLLSRSRLEGVRRTIVTGEATVWVRNFATGEDEPKRRRVTEIARFLAGVTMRSIKSFIAWRSAFRSMAATIKAERIAGHLRQLTRHEVAVAKAEERRRHRLELKAARARAKRTRGRARKVIRHNGASKKMSIGSRR